MGANSRNHFIKFGLEKYIYDTPDSLIEWEKDSRSYLKTFVELLPFDFSYVGSTWFK